MRGDAVIGQLRFARHVAFGCHWSLASKSDASVGFAVIGQWSLVDRNWTMILNLILAEPKTANFLVELKECLNCRFKSKLSRPGGIGQRKSK